MSQICFSQSTFLFVVLLILGFILVMFYHTTTTTQRNISSLISVLPPPIPAPSPVPTIISTPIPIVVPTSISTPTSVVVPVPIEITVVPDTSLPERGYVQMNDTQYHKVGFLYSQNNSTMRLYSRRKYPRGERYEYYVIDKNGIQIPFTTKNDVEIFDGDLVMIPEFADTLKATIYPVQNLFYNPNVN